MSDALVDADFTLSSPTPPSPRPATAPAPRAPRDAPLMLGREYGPVLADWQAAIDRRVRAEASIDSEFGGASDEEQQRLARDLSDIIEARAAAVADLDAEEQQLRNEAELERAAAAAEARSEHQSHLHDIESRYGAQASEIEEKFRDSAWVTSSVLDDTAEDSPRRQFDRFRQSREVARDRQAAELEALQAAFEQLAAQRRWQITPPTPPDMQPRSSEEAAAGITERTDAARAQLDTIRSLKLPQLFLGKRPFVVFAVLVLITFPLLFFLIDPSLLGMSGVGSQFTWGVVSAGAAAVFSVVLLAVVYTLGSMRQAEAFHVLQQSVGEAGWLHQQWMTLTNRDYQKQQADFEARQSQFESRRQSSLTRFERAHEERRAEIERGRSAELQTENARYHDVQTAIAAAHESRVQAIDKERRERRAQVLAAFDDEQQKRSAAVDQYGQHRRRQQAEIRHQLKTDWDAAARRLESSVSTAGTHSLSVFRPWDELTAGQWSLPREIPHGVRLGEFAVDLNEWEHALPNDVRLAPRSAQLALPAVAHFPDGASLLIKANSKDARRAAVGLLQTAMLRLLTLLPPGKLRFIILDPVGLGESFSGFMHLADFDELLVTRRIWTEPDQIEERLADLTEHMENVLQKYLRNEFASIEEYNAHAGEVAEPYQFLVITDFPSKFSDMAARRLASIVTSGPRCGVYTLISMDPKAEAPHSFNPAVLTENMSTLVWRDGAFHAAQGALADWPLRIDQPPPPEQFTAIVRQAGEASKDARRVEVAFDRIAPKKGEFWSRGSSPGIDLPLGRAGATKLQHLRLGKGTSQHMLVAGKTGSGKSTFLHCLITNLALFYSPDEVRFYLIDFKKGVEFKDYAAFHLPHADVIAIESDREFGVSALQRLDAVLQERGDLFRRHGVQDLAGYRATRPETPFPRILLIIDEFQEFFTEDDKLSQTAALLLDRLVRQGRAFGIHVVLGSQTLGGAYSLARSTMGQVAVRVALQCSDADAHLILSEENTAARLLTRPGEAIYNDANGLLEGNHPFQIAWLPDNEREIWLRRIARLAREQNRDDPPAIVFEGNIASDPARNTHITQLLQPGRNAAGVSPGDSPPQAPTIWLGEAVEIKQATSVRFARQNGSNLLLVGQDGEAAQGILATAVLTLAAQLQLPPDTDDNAAATDDAGESSNARPYPITVLDGSPLDSSDAAAWKRIAAAFPQTIRLAAPRDAAPVVAEFAAERQQRAEHPDAPHSPRFLVIYHLGRFRDLRKSDDDFSLGSFGGGEKPVEPGRLFGDLLAQGPEVALHTLIWCDSSSNVDRWFGRQTLRELEYRVAFQMNASDSSNLIDSPVAAKLGVHRALLYREETGNSEKFRPYGVPTAAWLDALKSGDADRDAHSTRTQTAPAASSSGEPDAPSDASAEAEPDATMDDFDVT